MTIHRDDLDRAVADGVLTRAQADALWERTDEHALAAAPRVDPRRAALALGLGAAAALAGGALLLDAWERIGPAAGLTVALLEGAALTAAAHALSRRPGQELQATVLAALAVPLAPVVVRAAQAWVGVLAAAAPPPTTFAAWLSSPVFLPAAAAVAAAIAALWAVPAPPLSAVLVVTFWGTAMTFAPVVFGPAPTWAQHALLSLLVGVAAMAAGVAVDGRLPRDHARWLYVAGLAALCGGVATLHADTGLSLAVGLAAYLGLVLVGLALRRRSFAVFGAIGIGAALARLADDLLEDPVVPFVFLAIAAGLVAATILFDRVATAWERAVVSAVPAPLRRLLPPRAR